MQRNEFTGRLGVLSVYSLRTLKHIISVINTSTVACAINLRCVHSLILIRRIQYMCIPFFFSCLEFCSRFRCFLTAFAVFLADSRFPVFSLLVLATFTQDSHPLCMFCPSMCLTFDEAHQMSIIDFFNSLCFCSTCQQSPH